MRIQSRIKRAIKAFRGSEIKKSFSSSVRGGKSHPVLDLIGGHHQYDAIQDPRTKIGLSRVLVKVLPMFQQAIQLQADLIGEIDIKTEIPELKQTLDSFIRSISIRFEDNPEMDHFFGMNNYNKQLVKVALMDGMAFSEDYFSSDSDGTMDGLLIYRTEKFNFKEDQTTKRKELVYQGIAGRDIHIQKSDHFNIFGVSFLPGSLWGLSMVDGGEFFAEILVQMLVARKDNYLRLGSPAGLNVFKVNDTEGLGEDEWKELVKRLEEGEQNYTDAVASMEAGKKKEVFMKLPAMVDFDHKMYGEGSPGLAGFKDDFIIIMRVLGLLTGIPAEFWLEASSAGIGSDKFQVLKGLLASTISTTRGLLEPINKRILINYLISIEAPPQWLEAFEIGWRDLDISDQKKQAETAKLEAETVASVIESAEKLFLEMGYNAEQVNGFLTSMGLVQIEVKPDA